MLCKQCSAIKPLTAGNLGHLNQEEKNDPSHLFSRLSDKSTVVQAIMYV